MPRRCYITFKRILLLNLFFVMIFGTFLVFSSPFFYSWGQNSHPNFSISSDSDVGKTGKFTEVFTDELPLIDTIDEELLRRHFTDGALNSPRYQEIHGKCANPVKWGAQYIFQHHLSPYPYLHQAEKQCFGGVDLLIAVHTRAIQARRRQVIRNTWGSLRKVKNARVLVIFFMGTSNSTNSTTQTGLNEEAKTYGDIVQRKFTDDSPNLSLKQLMMMEWVLDFCPQTRFLLKSNDDSFIDPFHVIHFIQEHPPNVFLCHQQVMKVPQLSSTPSSQGDDDDIMNHYPGTEYPPYCEGFAYLMDASKVKDILWCSMFTKYVPLDSDVFITGILRDRLNLRLEEFWLGHGSDELRPSHASELMRNYMVLKSAMGIIPETADKIWRGILARQGSFLE